MVIKKQPREIWLLHERVGKQPYQPAWWSIQYGIAAEDYVKALCISFNRERKPRRKYRAVKYVPA